MTLRLYLPTPGYFHDRNSCPHREREIKAFLVKPDLCEHTISARRRRIECQSLLCKRFRPVEIFRTEFGPP